MSPRPGSRAGRDERRASGGLRRRAASRETSTSSAPRWRSRPSRGADEARRRHEGRLRALRDLQRGGPRRAREGAEAPRPAGREGPGARPAGQWRRPAERGGALRRASSCRRASSWSPPTAARMGHHDYDALGDPLPTHPMVVLINHDTASAAEILTSALGDHHLATIVGTRSFGKGTFQEVIHLDGRRRARPDGRRVSDRERNLARRQGDHAGRQGGGQPPDQAGRGAPEGARRAGREDGGREQVSPRRGAALGRRVGDRGAAGPLLGRRAPLRARPRRRRWLAARWRCGRATWRWSTSAQAAPRRCARWARRSAPRDVVAALLWDREAAPGLPGARSRTRHGTRRPRRARAPPLTRRDLTDLADLHRRSGDRARLRRRRLGRPRTRRRPALDPHRRRVGPRAAGRRAGRGGPPARRPAPTCPGTVEPMLPQRCSATKRAAWLPGVDRLAVTAEIVLDGERRAAVGELLSEPHPLGRASRLRPAGRDLRGPRARPPAAVADAAWASRAERRRRSPRAAPVGVARDRVLRAGVRVRRRRSGGPAPTPSTQTEAHRLIEHLMILTNERVAELCERRHVPDLYRVHEQPDPERIERLVEQLAALDVPTPPLPKSLIPVAGRRARRGDKPPGGKRGGAARTRPRRVYISRAPLPEAGLLLRAKPGPRRPRQPRLRAFHLADQALPGPRRPPRAAVGGRGGRGRAGPRARPRGRAGTARSASGEATRRSATPTTSAPRSCSGASCSRAGGARRSRARSRA